jgi:putative ABC transport system substrate-binding protein
MMRRRRFLVSLGAGLVVPLVAEARQAGKAWRIGLLVSGPPPSEHVCVLALRRGLHDLGYVEGQTYVFEIRSTQGAKAEEAFPRLGAELVELGVDVIVSVTGLGLVEAKTAMATVPVVMAVSEHPVERRLIASLGRPGGNITGLATFTDEMFSKRVQILAEALPGVSRIAVLRLPGTVNDLIVRDLETAARRLGLKLQVIEVQDAQDFPAAFLRAVRGHAQAIMTTQGPFFFQYRREIADLALKHKLPSFSGEPQAADAGFLMTAGASIPASCHRAATYVDRILKGAKPADLPVEQTTKFELVINLKTAKVLGLTIPQSVLVRADQIIE